MVDWRNNKLVLKKFVRKFKSDTTQQKTTNENDDVFNSGVLHESDEVLDNRFFDEGKHTLSNGKEFWICSQCKERFDNKEKYLSHSLANHS